MPCMANVVIDPLYLSYVLPAHTLHVLGHLMIGAIPEVDLRLRLLVPYLIMQRTDLL